MNQFLQAQTRTAETDSQPVRSVVSGKIKVTLAFIFAGVLAAVFASKGKNNGSETVSETVNKPLLKRGETFVDPETGEEMIVTKKGGRKKKVTQPKKASTTLPSSIGISTEQQETGKHGGQKTP